MRKIDVFAHILPRSYLERLERQLEKTMAPSRLDYYRAGVFSFDPVLTCSIPEKLVHLIG
jgi:hypothetical protein